jgi:DNA-binding NarL/FixJ family response regulator
VLKGSILKLRVFLVEDQQRLRSLMDDLFQGLGGFQVVGAAASEAEALAWFDEHRDGCDVAIIDLVLEQGSGLGTIRRARRTQPNARILVFSGYASPGVQEHCRGLGADVVFNKVDSGLFVRYLANLADAVA